MGIPTDSTLKILIRGNMCFYDEKHEVILFSVLSHNRGEKSFWMVSRPLSWISKTSSVTPVSHSPCFCASLEAVLRYFFLCPSGSLRSSSSPSLVPFFSGVRHGSAQLCLPSPPPSSPLPFAHSGGLRDGGGWVGVGRMKKWVSPVNHADWICPLCEDETL